MRRSRAANDQIDRAERIATYLGGLSPEAAAAFTAIGEDAAALSAGLSAAAGAAHQAVVDSGVAQRVWLSACDRVELTTAAAGEAISRLRLVLRRVEGEGNRAVIRHLRAQFVRGTRRGASTLAELRTVVPLLDELIVPHPVLLALRDELAAIEATLEEAERDRREAREATAVASDRRTAAIAEVDARTKEALVVWTLGWRQQTEPVLAEPDVPLPPPRRSRRSPAIAAPVDPVPAEDVCEAPAIGVCEPGGMPALATDAGSDDDG